MARWAIWARWAAETGQKKHPGLYWRWNMSMRSIPNLNKNPVATTKKFTHYWLKSLFLRMTKEQPLKTNKNMRSCKDTLQSSILFAVEKYQWKWKGAIMKYVVLSWATFLQLWSDSAPAPGCAPRNWGGHDVEQNIHGTGQPSVSFSFALVSYKPTQPIFPSNVLNHRPSGPCPVIASAGMCWNGSGQITTVCRKARDVMFLAALKKTIPLTVPETRTIISCVTHGGHIVTTGRPNGDAFFNPGQVVIVTGDCHQANNLCTLHSPLFQHVELAKARCRHLEKVPLKRLEPKEATSAKSFVQA